MTTRNFAFAADLRPVAPCVYRRHKRSRVSDNDEVDAWIRLHVAGAVEIVRERPWSTVGVDGAGST